MKHKIKILGILLLLLMPMIDVAGVHPPVSERHKGVVEVPYSVNPNISIEHHPPFYDVHVTPLGDLVHSECSTIPVGISFGRTPWYKNNWCHQIRGVYLNG